MIKKESVVVAADNLSVAELNGEAVVLDVDTGMYYGLNEVGTRILELVRDPVTVETVISLMLREYDVTEAQLSADVTAFLSELARVNLVLQRNGVGTEAEVFAKVANGPLNA